MDRREFAVKLAFEIASSSKLPAGQVWDYVGRVVDSAPGWAFSGRPVKTDLEMKRLIESAKSIICGQDEDIEKIVSDAFVAGWKARVRHEEEQSRLG